MPKRPEAYMAERRQQIVDAMMQCVTRDGWDATTIDAVAREAGLSKGAVYGHFDSKQEILAAVIDYDLDRLDRIVRRDDLKGIEKAVIESLLPLTSTEGWPIAAGLLEMRIEAARDPGIRSVVAEGGNRTTGIVAKLVRKSHPEMAPHMARLLALSFLCLTNGVVALRSFGVEISEAEVRELISAHLQTIMHSAHALEPQ